MDVLGRAPGLELVTETGVRRSCQTIAFMHRVAGCRSQTMVVSRWLVMPIAAIPSAETPAVSRTFLATVIWVFQMSSGLCSTQPGMG